MREKSQTTKRVGSPQANKSTPIANRSLAIKQVQECDLETVNADPATLHLFLEQMPDALNRQQQRFAGRHWLAEKLSCLANRPLIPTDITYSANGKPAVADMPWGFSFSNAGHFVALAAMPVGGSNNPCIGLDMEIIKPGKDRTRLARRYFAAKELAALNKLSEPEKTRAFYALWTAKEARTKYAGGRLWHCLRRSIWEGESAHPHWLLASGSSDKMLCLWLEQPLTTLILHPPAATGLTFKPWTWH